MLILHIVFGLVSLLLSLNCLMAALNGTRASHLKILIANLSFLTAIITGLLSSDNVLSLHFATMILVFTVSYSVIWLTYRVKIKKIAKFDNSR